MSQRSAAYPSFTLIDSLELAKKIYKAFSSNYRASREQIAEALGYGRNSVNIKLSTAVQYGLLDMVSKQGYQVTPLFVRWHRPISEQDEQDSLIEAFKQPTLYQKLLQTFEGDILPPLRPLASILLQNHNISEKACDKAAEIFVENAKIVNALNEERLLSFNDVTLEVEEDDEEDIFEEQEEVLINDIQKPNKNSLVVQKENNNSNSQDVNSKNQDNKSFKGGNPIPHNIPLKNKLPAQLLLPSDVSSADFDFIISYIGLIRNQY